MILRVLLVLLIALPACEAGDRIPDTQSADVGDTAGDTEEDEIQEPIVGCDWATGSWLLVDCTGAVFSMNFVPSVLCGIQILSPSAVFAGAWGSVKDAGISIFLPVSNKQCHGAWDGTTLVGACDTLTGPCSFTAEPNSS